MVRGSRLLWRHGGWTDGGAPAKLFPKDARQKVSLLGTRAPCTGRVMLDGHVSFMLRSTVVPAVLVVSSGQCGTRRIKERRLLSRGRDGRSNVC